MHYANGRAAKAGDVVRGKGYNIKHEITGLLVFANPGGTACNCQVACVTKHSPVLHYGFPEPGVSSDGSLFFKGMVPPSFCRVEAVMEYGQLDAFVALDPATGAVLPPEVEQPIVDASPTAG